jgi:6-phosphogluconolactonase (cycloisomerase 2 family)
VYSTNSFGGAPIPLGAAAAEIVVSPDNKFLMVSNRNDSSFSIDNYNPANKTLEFSDSIATFALNSNGSLAFKQLWPAGGLFPRQFSINAAGDMIAVGLQTSGRVVIISRDVKTGLLGQAVANSPIGTAELGPTCIVWDE